MEKKSVSDLRAELKVLREGHPDFKPVSKMRKSDISELLYKLKNHTMTTPAVAMEKKVAKVPMMAEPKKTAHAKQKKISEYTEVESDEAPKKSKAPAKMPAKIPATKEHKQKAEKEHKKETMKEKMAKIRALKK